MTYVDDLFSLAGQQALVTGAARGNGRAIAEGLLRAGAEVLLVDIDESQLHATLGELQDMSLPAQGECCDLSIEQEIMRLVNAIPERLPGISILVNNAGVTLPGPFMDYPLDDWETTYRVNLKAPFLLSQRLAPRLAKNGQATILNITSLNAELAFPNNPAYVAFKGALKQLTKSMALDLADHGIRVNSIGPGYMRTAMTSASWNDPKKREDRSRRTMLGRWGEPEDLIGTTVFLASRASAYITGQEFYVDGGWLAKGL